MTRLRRVFLGAILFVALLVSVPLLTQQVAAEGVKSIVVLADDAHKYGARPGFAAGVSVLAHDQLERVQRELREVAGTTVIVFDQVCATSRDLAALVRDGSFREDLFYRLNVLPIRVPPLRERRSDIPALVETLGDDIAHRNNMAWPEVLPDALSLLAGQTWRGNIRELRNVLEQTVMQADTDSIDARLLERILRNTGLEQIAPALAPAAAAVDGGTEFLQPLAAQIAQLEQRAIAAALKATGGNKQATARLLGISRATLYGRLENPDL